MSSRRFSLQAVLDLRASAKERAEEALAASILERDRIAVRCVELETKVGSMADRLVEERFTVDSRERGWNVLCRQRDLCREGRATLEEAERRVTGNRAKLVSASIDHELVLRLEKKWLAVRARMQARAIEQQLEEFVMSRRKLNPHPR